jgi:sugar lactone lactonase YvrE
MPRKQTLVLSLVLSFSIAAVAAPPSGVVTTVAGTAGVAGYWDGPSSDAMFTHPTWLDVVASTDRRTCDEGKSGEVFVVDRINQSVRRIDQSGNVSTFKILHRQFVGAGPIVAEIPLDFDSAFGGGVLVEQPGDGCGCSVYSRGVFFASTGANQVVLAHPSGDLAARDDWSPILGTGQAGAADGDSNREAQFNKPVGLARSKDTDQPFGDIFLKRKVYVADSGNHTIRQINWSLSFEACPQGRAVKTLAGSAGQPGSADGTGSAARFNTPRGIAVGPDNSIYVTDSGNHTVRKITPDGVVTTVAGTPGVAGSDETHLNTPSGIDVNDKGEVFIVDTFNHAIRMLKDGVLTTIAGQLGVSGFADGDAAAAKFNAPVGLKIAPDGSLVIADTGNNVIRRLTLTR